MLSALQKVAQSVLQSARDLAPVLLVLIVFQLFVIREPLPGMEQKILGFVFVLIGLTLFVRGLDMSIFRSVKAWLIRSPGAGACRS
jgi:hypothetical protein